MDDKVVFCAVWFVVCTFVQSYSSALAFLESVHGVLQAGPSGDFIILPGGWMWAMAVTHRGEIGSNDMLFLLHE